MPNRQDQEEQERYEANQLALARKYGPNAKSVMENAATAANHASQNHPGDNPSTCPQCGFSMDQTVLQPSLSNLKSGLTGQ